jgi:hypothetical protein
MKHKTYLNYSLCKPLLLILAIFLSSASFLSAVPPIYLQGHEREFIQKIERKATKKQWKKEARKKIRSYKLDRKVSRKAPLGKLGKVLLTIFTILLMVALTAFPSISLLLLFDTSFDILMIFLSAIILTIISAGIWAILEINRKGSDHFLRLLKFTVLILSTLILISLFLSLGFGPGANIFLTILGSILGLGVLFLGTWLFIRMLSR